MLNMPRLDEASTPYLEAWSLIELRNFLVHYKPTLDPAGERQIRLEEVLDGQFHLSPFLEEGADFVSMKCMSSGCAKWAVKAVVMFVSEFDSRAHIEAHKMRAFLSGRRP